MQRPIGVFDSGVGGLTVAKELMHHLPQEKIIYFGDTAHLPYGIKSPETVTRLSLENILFLLKQNVKLVIVACNTASSVALPRINKYFNIPVMGVIWPGVREAVAVTRNKRVGIIATRATIKSQSYVEEIKKLDSTIKVFSVACPLFVPLVEEGWLNSKVTEDVARNYLEPFKKYKIDTLILGCTHYPLLKPVIKKVLGKNIVLIDSARQVALEVKRILEEKGICSRFKSPAHEFYVSDEPANFKELAQAFLNKSIKNILLAPCLTAGRHKWRTHKNV